MGKPLGVCWEVFRCRHLKVREIDKCRWRCRATRYSQISKKGNATGLWEEKQIALPGRGGWIDQFMHNHIISFAPCHGNIVGREKSRKPVDDHRSTRPLAHLCNFAAHSSCLKECRILTRFLSCSFLVSDSFSAWSFSTRLISPGMKSRPLSRTFFMVWMYILALSCSWVTFRSVSFVSASAKRARCLVSSSSSTNSRASSSNSSIQAAKPSQTPVPNSTCNHT